MSQPLFRPAVRREPTKLFGNVIVARPLSFRLLTLLTVCVLSGMVAFLLWGGYAKKETVTGHIVPGKGVVEVFPNSPGRFAELAVSEGQRVERGDRLLLVHSATTTEHGQDASAEALALVEGEIAMIEAAIVQEGDRFATEALRLSAQREGIGAELFALTDQRRVLTQRLRLAHDNQRRAGAVRDLISGREYSSEQSQQLSIEQERSALAQRQATQSTLHGDLGYRLQLLPAERNAAIRALQNQLAAQKQRKLEIKNGRSHELTAPVSGVVTAVRAVVGSAADPRQPALFILPEGSSFAAHLFVPTRAVGFVEPSQSVRLLYDAFPYQQFGAYDGRLVEVTKTVLAPNEIPIPLTRSEPVYRVTVELAKQAVSAYGRAYPLQAGMLVHADIVLAKRSLIEWLLEPLYSLRGRT